MQLDRTYIGIRQRSPFEVWDLTLQVLRQHFGSVAALLIVGILPWFVANHLVTMWLVSEDYYDDHVFWFYWLTACLVVSQAQIGTFWIAQYLGQAMFHTGVTANDTLKRLRKRGNRMFFAWLHLVNRMVLPVLMLVACLLLFEDEEAIYFFGGLLIPFVVFIGLIVRGRTPYLSEILLLEEAPRKSSSPGVQTYRARSSSLLRAPGADFFLRFLLASIIGTGLALALYESFCLVDSILGLQSLASTNLNFMYWQVSLWLAAAFVAVNRFLSYIDLRIRTEGWAVRLRLMAEEKRAVAEY